MEGLFQVLKEQTRIKSNQNHQKLIYINNQQFTHPTIFHLLLINQNHQKILPGRTEKLLNIQKSLTPNIQILPPPCFLAETAQGPLNFWQTNGLAVRIAQEVTHLL